MNILIVIITCWIGYDDGADVNNQIRYFSPLDTDPSMYFCRIRVFCFYLAVA